MTLDKQPERSGGWKIRQGDPQNNEWIVELGKDLLTHRVILEANDTFPDGLYVSDFDQLHTRTSLSRKDLANLASSVLECLHKSGLSKLYFYPANLGLAKLSVNLKAGILPASVDRGEQYVEGEVDERPRFFTVEQLEALSKKGTSRIDL